MSKYDEERKRLGLKPLGSTSSSSTSTQKESKYAKEREALFNPPAQEQEQVQVPSRTVNTQLMEATPAVQSMRSGGNLLDVYLRNNPQVQPRQEQAKSEPEDNRNRVQRVLDYIFRENPIARVINYPFAKAAQLSVPDAPLIREGRPVEGTSARQLHAELNPVRSTGSETLDRIGDVAGQVGSYFLNPAAPSQGPVALYNAARNLTLTRPVQAVSQRVTNPVANRALREAVQESATAAAYAVPSSLIRGDTTAPEIAKNVAIEGSIGAVTGGAVGAIGETIGRALQSRRSQQNRLTSEPRQEVSPESQRANMPPASSTANTMIQAAQPVRQGWFERLFGTQPMGIISRVYSRSRNPLTTEGQIVDTPIRRTTRGTVETIRAAARSAYQSFIDMNSPIKRISREAYDASIDAARANQIANVIITDKFVNPQGQVLGEGLQNIIRKAGRGNYNAFTDYLIARHALTRMNRGERVYAEHLNMTPEKVAERIQTLEQMYPGFREIAQEWDQYFKNIREVYGVEEGLLSRELADLLEQRNPNYAPMRRQFTDAEKIKGFTGQRQMFSGQKAPIQEVSPTGSARKIVDPVRSTIEQTGAWVQAAMRNRVMRIIVDEILKNPEEMRDIAEIVQPPKGSPNLRQLILQEGEEGFLENLAEDFNKLFQRQRVDKDNIVRAMVNGQPIYVKVKDPEAVKALLGLGAENANIALRVMTTFSNMIKRGATGALAPLFAVKSATMDVAQALIQAENPLQHAGYLMGAVVSSIADVLRIPGLRRMAQDFYRAGGGYSAALRGERALRRSVGSMRLDPLLSPRTIARGIGNVIAFPYRASLTVADIAENMNRIAAYHYKLRQLGGEPTPENIRQAMNYAREITINYSRRGRQSQMLESLIPYNNAAIQGLFRFARAWKENPVKTTAMVALGVLLPKFYEYMQFHDDPDYNNLPARERYRNLFLHKNEDGTFVKIPLSPEYNALGALMVDMLRAWRDGDPEAFKGTSDALANAYMPPLMSGLAQGFTQGGGIDQSISGAANATSLAPIAAVMANQTFYGAPIDSRKVEDRSPQYRYDERTSAIAKWLGEQLKWSPMKIDYVLRAYGGDPARLLLPLTSEVGQGTTRNTLLRNWITDPVFTNTLTDDFYMGKELLTQAYRDHQEVGAPLPEWYDDGLRRMVTSTAKGSVTKRLSALNEQKRQVNMDKSLSAEEKAQKLRDIQRQINEIYIEVNSLMREAGVPILSR